jgi:hypothetical protein
VYLNDTAEIKRTSAKIIIDTVDASPNKLPLPPDIASL